MSKTALFLKKHEGILGVKIGRAVVGILAMQVSPDASGVLSLHVYTDWALGD